VSTHSFRRTALTQMSNAGIPLRVIQEISGHRTLDELYKYLEVSPEQVRGAITSLSMLTPASEQPVYFEKPLISQSFLPTAVSHNSFRIAIARNTTLLYCWSSFLGLKP
jgi:hypothetical protein